MAKYNPNKSSKNVKSIKYPSEFGSHLSMVNSEYESFNESNHEFVVCTDARGHYITLKSVLDNNLCDFNRSLNLEKREALFASHNLD